ncbi:MAG: hypothetical protein Q8807_03875 ['Waltheria sp.' little leaf phytoplasma]|nr:hypothetical protein ['Waltheria sp.' little leaf phytoplasma]
MKKGEDEGKTQSIGNEENKSSLDQKKKSNCLFEIPELAPKHLIKKVII